MSLATIEQAFVAAASAEWDRIKAEGIKIEQVIVADAETVFAQLSVQFAPVIMTFISNLAVGQLAKLSGDEKTNLAATQLVDHAAQQGIAILAADATGLIKNGFEAFKNAAPDLGLPSNVSNAANSALDAAEKTAEGAVGQAASAAGSAASKL